MSKNRNSKKFRKRLKNKSKIQSNNSQGCLSEFEKIKRMFGNPNIDKFLKLTENGSTELTLNRFLEGEKEFQKVIKSFKKNYISKKLEKLNKTNPELYTIVLEVFLFTPYKKFGNKSKVWFQDFYEFISKLPKTQTLPENNIISLYRVMTKSEFLKSLENGVQNPSWTLDLGIVMKFVKKNLLTMDENIIVVKSIFLTSEVSYSPSDITSGESEIWIRKGSKSIRTFVIGEYNKTQYLTQFDNTKIHDEKLSSLREIMSGSNGFGTNESTELRNSMLSESHDDVLYKFTKYDLPKLVRKLKKDRVTKSIGDLNSLLQDILGKYINSYESLCNKISPLTI